MEIIEISVNQIILKFTTKGSQTRHANLWGKNNGILEIIKHNDLTTIYRLKEKNHVLNFPNWNEPKEYRSISFKFNNFSVNDFISKCKEIKTIDVSYGCLLDKFEVFRNNDSRFDWVAYSIFKNVGGKYVEQLKEKKEYPFEFLYNYKTRLSVDIQEDRLDICLTFLDKHLENWKDENNYYD